MEHSKLFRLKLKEVGRGFAVAIVGAVITSIYTGIQSGVDVFHVDWMATLNVGIAAGIAYLSQKYFRNSNDELLKSEKK